MEANKLNPNKQVVRSFVEKINDRRLEDLNHCMAVDVIDYNKIIHGEADEPGAAFDGIRQQLEAFQPYQIRIEELIAENDRVVARMIQNGTHSGTHPRMPQPTNRRCENEAIFIFTVTDKKITEIPPVSDRLGLFLQLGWDWPMIIKPVLSLV